MEIEKINDILSDVSIKSNSDLINCRDFLYSEFEKTKELIIDLTRHLDIVENSYNLINKEIGKRTK